MEFRTNELIAGDAYSLWAFSGGSPLLVTGDVADDSGRAKFEGDVISPAPITHLVLRNHGPKLPGDAQFLDPNGGCPPNMCSSVQRADF